MANLSTYEIAQGLARLEHLSAEERKGEQLAPELLIFPLSADVTVELSEDGFVWYVWYTNPGSFSNYLKIVPRMDYSAQELVEILLSQKWKEVGA